MPFHDKKLYFVEQLTVNIGVIMDTVLCKDCKHSFRTRDILSLLFWSSGIDYKCRKAFTEKSDDGHLFKCFINVRNYLDARKLSELTPSFEINEKELIMFFKKNGIYSKEMEKSIKDFFKKQYLKKTFWSYLNNYGIDIPSSYKEIYDAIFLNEHSLNGTKINVYFVHESNQIKLADGTNTTFDGNNPDIRYAGGGVIPSINKPYKLVVKISNINQPNEIVSRGIKNKYKGSYAKIFDILNENSIFNEIESVEDILVKNDLYVFFVNYFGSDDYDKIASLKNVEIFNNNEI